MANITKLITLTSKANNAGPIYDIYYSLDCNNFVLASNGSGVSLPNIGSTYGIVVPDNAICLKL